MNFYDENEGFDFKKIGMIIAFIVVIAIILFSVIPTYNNLINLREEVNLQKANVEEKMQRRLELIPDLVEIVKAQSAHEEKVFSDIANARQMLSSKIDSGADPEEISEANAELSMQIDNLFHFVVENYPELASSEQYSKLQDEVAGSANRISRAREECNEAIAEYNKAIQYFPTSLFAKMMGFERFEEFKADEEANKTNIVDFN